VHFQTSIQLCSVLLIFSGCGDAAPDPCADCLEPDSSQGCFTTTVCADAGSNCQSLHVRCVDRCATSSDCQPGHQCIFTPATDDAGAVAASPPVDDDGGSVDGTPGDDGGEPQMPPTPLPRAGLCSPACDDAECNKMDRTACNSPTGVCAPADCSLYFGCLDPSRQLCDIIEHGCYPEDGACGDTGCPTFDGREAQVDHIYCDTASRTCKLAPNPLPIIPGLGKVDPVTVFSPVPGTSFPDAAHVNFDWQPPGTATILLVLDDIPASASSVLDHAVWALGLPADADAHAHWNDGVDVVADVWTTSVSPPPLGKPLYLVVESVHFTTLEAISPIIPFSVGRLWTLPGDACISDGTLPGPCENPGVPQACVDGQCRLLCASQRDCLDATNGMLGCSPPQSIGTNGRPIIRFCE